MVFVSVFDLEAFFLIFLVWLQRNLLQLSDICNFIFLSDQPVPSSFSISCTTIFFRWSGVLENVRWRWSLNHWRHEFFSLFKDFFPTSVLLISPEIGSYSIMVPKLPIDDAYAEDEQEFAVLRVAITQDVSTQCSSLLVFDVIDIFLIFFLIEERMGNLSIQC